MNNILEATLQIKDAHNEGVTFHFLENIKEVLRDESGKVTGVKVITMELGESDESEEDQRMKWQVVNILFHVTLSLQQLNKSIL